ncbi:MAG: translocation/assembly module TamB domain-containing protein [Halioglobus sp.]|nr:translocation/assembly module TamB domain-containing protein [Halioglobus sp.]
MKALSRTLLTLVLIGLLLCAALLYVIFTEQGGRGLAAVAARVLPLEIEYGSGYLAGRLHVVQLRYTSDDVRVELRDVTAQLSAACLWRGAICFQHLQVGSLDVLVLPGDEASGDTGSAAAEPAPVQLIDVPLPLRADALDINRLRVRWPGGEWRQGALAGSVRLHHATVTVDGARVLDSRLVLASLDGDEAATAGPTRLPAIDLPLQLSVSQLQLINPAWDFYGVVYQQDALSLSGNWQHSALQLQDVTARGEDIGELSLRGALTFAGDWPLDVTAELQLPESRVNPALWGSAVQVAATGDLSALALSVKSGGGIDFAIEAQADVLSPGLPFSATAVAQASASSPTRVPLADLVPAAAGLEELEISLPWQAAVSGSLQSQEFELFGAVSGLGYAALDIAVHGLYEQDTLRISGLTIRDDAGDNTLQGEGELAVTDGYSFSFALHSDGLDLPPLSDAVRGRIGGALQLAGEVAGERWQLRVTSAALQGRINDLPASVTGHTGLDSDLRLSASDLRASLNGARLSVTSPGEAVGPGHIRLEVDDLGRWQAGSRGQFELDADIAANRSQIRFSAALQRVLWSGLQFEQAELEGEYSTTGDRAVRLDASVDDIAYADIALRQLRLSARGDDGAQSLSLSSLGDIAGDLRVDGTLSDGQWRGSLAPTSLRTPLGAWTLSQRVGLRGSLAEETFSVDAHCWRQQYAQLCPAQWSLGRDGGGGVQLNADLAILQDLLPRDVDVQGELRVAASARWQSDGTLHLQADAQTGAVTITQHFEEGQSATFGWDRADIGLAYAGTGLQLNASVQRDGKRLVGVDLLLPRERSDAISGAVVVDRLRLGAFAPFVPALSTLAGEVSGRVAVSGTVDAPRGTGALVLSGGELVLADNPTRLDDVELTFNVRGRSAAIRGTGNLGGGQLQLTGSVETVPELRVALAITGDEHLILYPPATELKISESLQIELKKDLLAVHGEVTVLDGLLEIEALPEGGVALSPSVVEVNPDGSAINEQLPFDVRMNVQIHIDDRLQLVAPNLQTHLGGDLDIRQRPGQPMQVFGNLGAVGGEFRAYQARLQIKRGSLNFTGPPTNPTVDVRAERHISSGDVTVGVSVQGPLQDELQLDVYSQPSMSQADAMSYLVRGRGMDAGAGLDGTSLALSLASGVVNRSELVTELNRIPGLSNVSFGAQGTESDTAATISGYLGERLYLSYGVGIYEPVNVLTTRFYFRSRLWLEVVSSIENSLDLYYSFDID